MYSLDYLGGTRYKDVILKNHFPGWGAGFLQGSDRHHRTDGFGDVFPLVNALAAKAITPIIEIHLKYDDNHRFDRNTLELVVKRAEDLLPIVQRHQDICNFDVSPYLEHQIRDKAFLDETFSRVKAVLPMCNLVNSPIAPGLWYPGAVNETHADESYPLTQPMSYSTDGASAYDCDIDTYKQKYFYRSRTFRFWVSMMNGKRNTKGDPGDKVRANRKFWLTADHYPHLLYLTTEKGNTSLPKHWIGKAQGDQHNVKPSGNDLKPVLIAPVAGTRLGLRAAGRVIATSTGTPVLYRETRYPVRRYIYRFGEYGYRLGKIAWDLQHHGVCEVIDLKTKKVYGRWNPGFRENEYRTN